MSKKPYGATCLGPEAYNNWKKWSENHEGWFTCEYPLFTDAHVTGELTKNLGPYQFINAVPRSLGKCVALTLILRVEIPGGMGDIPPMEETDDFCYHGGTMIDELAALLSLQMGIRLRAGKSIRTFYPEGDPKGRPEAFEMPPDPVTPQYSDWPVVPNVRGKHPMPEPTLFSRLIELNAADAIVLIKTSRLYQDALWISESQPEMSWLMMVSAVETAAHHWRQSNEKPVERLRISQPKLEQILISSGGEDHLSRVAEIMAPYMGATKKFIDFVMKFLPSPPSIRPPEWAQCSWDPRNMKKALSKIYNHRSKALHGGIPFPKPMCTPPMKAEGFLAEKPHGKAAFERGGVWVEDDLPMVLNTFEFITRNVLLRWWSSILEV